MVFLAKFLLRNLKGYRLLVILAILVAFAQVGSDLLAAMPLKFIPSKVNNPGSGSVAATDSTQPTTWTTASGTMSGHIYRSECGS